MGATHGIGVPPPNRTAERWPVTSPCDFFTCRGILSSVAIIIGFYHWGVLCVVCFSCHRSAVQVWGDMLTGGYVLNGLHPRLLSIRTYGALPGCFVLAGHGGLRRWKAP